MKKHLETCYMNPDNIRLCPVCNEPIKSKENKYCSSSCAAKISNLGRKYSKETRIKISKSLGGDGLKDKKCLRCDVDTINGRLYCDICLPIVLGENSNTDKANLSNVQYEENLSKILEQFYGKLRKEKINNIFPDFCNEEYIIDFTFDHTKGTNDLIKRFQKIQNDSRKKIAYIPNKNIGEFRRNKLIKINVDIKDSTPFKYLMN
jgi:predicted nucleic acid-binding Zn ribbon protein